MTLLMKIDEVTLSQPQPLPPIQLIFEENRETDLPNANLIHPRWISSLGNRVNAKS
jgi:hypothetical protein